MNAERSYKISEFTTSITAEIERLKAQIDLFWDQEKLKYEEFGLKDGTNILECGSGPGFLVLKLAERYPNCSIHSLEIDPVLIKEQKNNIKHLNEEKRITVHEGSLYENDLPHNSFDTIIMRLVLEHLPDAITALENMHSLLKENGTIIVVDNDFDYHLRTYPDIPELEQMYKAYCRLREEEGGNPRIGRQLPVFLQKARFSSIQFSMMTAHSNLLNDQLFLQSESAGISAVLLKKGYLSEDIFDRLGAQWNNLLSTENHLFFRPLFIAAGTKTVTVSGQTTPKKTGTADHIKAVKKKHNRAENENFGDNYESIMHYITGLINETLEISVQGSVNEDESLMTLGLDSITGMIIKNSIDEQFDINISLARLLKADTLKGVAQLILQLANDKKKTADQEYEEGEI